MQVHNQLRQAQLHAQNLVLEELPRLIQKYYINKPKYIYKARHDGLVIWYNILKFLPLP
jgi:hypothetical protein